MFGIRHRFRSFGKFSNTKPRWVEPMAVCIAFKRHAGFASHKLGRPHWHIIGALAKP